jgi:hypothetical protein
MKGDVVWQIRRIGDASWLQSHVGLGMTQAADKMVGAVAFVEC